MDQTERLHVPLDFNSLFIAEGTKLKLGNFYIEYAFYQEGLEPLENERVVFYDLAWRNSDRPEIMCIDGTLHKEVHDRGVWYAELEGKIYIKTGIPKRYYNAFIGVNTGIIGKDPAMSIAEAKKRPLYNPEDKFLGIDAHVFPAGSQIPEFNKIIGLEVGELSTLFNSCKKFPEPNHGPLPGDAIVARGGSNIIKDFRNED